MSTLRTALLLVIGLVRLAVDADAQPLGTFRWQIQPYCNLLTVNVTQQTGVCTLDGTDDRCGADQAASIVGIAFQNPNGSIGFGLNVVLSGGTPVHIEATVAFPSLNGTWRDSAGNSGTIIFTPGAGTGGPPRPVPSGGIAAGSVTSVQLAAGAVGATQLAANSVSTGHVADGSLTAADLAPGSVTSAQIAMAAVGSAQIAPNAVGGVHIFDGSITRADIGDAPNVSSVESVSSVALPNSQETLIAQLPVVAPAAGRVIVNATGSFSFPNGASIDAAFCSLTTSLDVVIPVPPYSAEAAERTSDALSKVPFGGTRTFSVAAGSTTFKLICMGLGQNISVSSPVLNALFVAGP